MTPYPRRGLGFHLAIFWHSYSARCHQPSLSRACIRRCIAQVLLVPHEPTTEWKRLVLNFAANDRVTYLKGDLCNSVDLSRVSAHTASSCFILSNRCTAPTTRSGVLMSRRLLCLCFVCFCVFAPKSGTFGLSTVYRCGRLKLGSNRYIVCTYVFAGRNELLGITLCITVADPE